MHTVRTASSVFLLIFLVLFLTVWPGCSVKKNYKTLSFFFDGVPKPGEEAKGREKKIRRRTVKKRVRKKPDNWVKIISRHPPFVERKCKECHNIKSLTFLKGKKDRLCYTCHKKEKFEGEYLHGPVAVGACLACHLPHESKYTKLLKLEKSQLCIGCHTLWDRRDVKAHSKGKICTQCHHSHAGSNRFLLKQPQKG
ncbi:MAG: hypothetical protein GY950_00285 [bacterium]|nr:hypothetical protein [bacterium]